MVIGVTTPHRGDNGRIDELSEYSEPYGAGRCDGE